MEFKFFTFEEEEEEDECSESRLEELAKSPSIQYSRKGVKRERSPSKEGNPSQKRKQASPRKKRRVLEEGSSLPGEGDFNEPQVSEEELYSIELLKHLSQIAKSAFCAPGWTGRNITVCVFSPSPSPTVLKNFTSSVDESCHFFSFWGNIWVLLQYRPAWVTATIWSWCESCSSPMFSRAILSLDTPRISTQSSWGILSFPFLSFPFLSFPFLSFPFLIGAAFSFASPLSWRSSFLSTTNPWLFQFSTKKRRNPLLWGNMGPIQGSSALALGAQSTRVLMLRRWRSGQKERPLKYPRSDFLKCASLLA